VTRDLASLDGDVGHAHAGAILVLLHIDRCHWVLLLDGPLL
jgi:hypothetical protein